MMMRNILLTIAYNGKNYAGWQIQKGNRTVQGELVKAIKVITGEDVVLYGSGRTDAGVHAYGQKANFRTASNIPAEKIAPALNTKMPSDISVIESCEMGPDFHAQYDAHRKTYCYRIYCSQSRNPFLDDFAWQVRLPKDFNEHLDIDLMREAAGSFLGKHDFSAFMSTGSSAQTTVREIYALTVREICEPLSSQMIEIDITGSGFLYNMVRIIAGTLVGVGKKEIDVKSIPKIISSGDRKRAGMTAPARGLMLMDVCY